MANLQSVHCSITLKTSRSIHLGRILAKDGVTKKFEKNPEQQEFELSNLNHITNLCINTRECRHSVLLKCFDETLESCSEMCDICSKPSQSVNTRDLTVVAVQLVKCLPAVQGKIRSGPMKILAY